MGLKRLGRRDNRSSSITTEERQSFTCVIKFHNVEVCFVHVLVISFYPRI